MSLKLDIYFYQDPLYELQWICFFHQATIYCQKQNAGWLFGILYPHVLGLFDDLYYRWASYVK